TTRHPRSSPTMPRARTAAPLKGSRLSRANRPSSVRKIATCTPWARTATPPSGIRSSAWQTAGQAAAPGAPGTAGVSCAAGAERVRIKRDMAFSSGLTGIGAFERRGPLRRRGGPRLMALAHVDDVLVGTDVVDHRPEATQRLRILERARPLALIGVDLRPHLRLEFIADAQAVLEDDLLQVIQAALEAFPPGGRALQARRRADVEHQETVDRADQAGIVQVAGQQFGMARAHAAIAAHVQV